MKRSLLLTNDFPPVVSGIATVFHRIWSCFQDDRMIVLTPHSPGSGEFDSMSSFRPMRFHIHGKGTSRKLYGMLKMFMITLYLVIFRGVRQIHTGQILSCGPVGYLFQKIFRIPCYLWVYGGETSEVYHKTSLEGYIVDRLMHESKFIITNSPVVSQEFRDAGIPSERILEIIPAVDSVFFSPGLPDQKLIDRFGLNGKKVLLTVARITPRKGHDLVLEALALLRRDDIRYVVVGSGDDRPRLEKTINEYGIKKNLIFAGEVENKDLPSFYRLCDIYVMPNREVSGSTDSVEGFGISFIEAAACGKPAIGGRSGGVGAAVDDKVTGFLVDPENPRDLAERIAFLLDNPEKAVEMGERGRERVEKDFIWKTRADALSRITGIPLSV